MAFNIRMGLPEMDALWNDLSTRKQQGKLDPDEDMTFEDLESWQEAGQPAKSPVWTKRREPRRLPAASRFD